MQLKYGIFETDLYRKEYPDKIDNWLDNWDENKLRNIEIADNYANHYNYGFYFDDDTHAILHALRMFIELQKENVSADQREVCLSILKNDMENYFLCVRCGRSNKIIFMEKLLKNLIGYGQDKWVVYLIQKYYNDVYYEKDESLSNIVNRAIKFDFANLYIQAGDKALYELEDVDLAMQYYILADIDWYGLFSEEWGVEVDLDESIRKEKIQLHKKIICYKQIAEGVVEKLDLAPINICGIGNLFAEILNMVDKGTSSKELVYKSNSFWLEFIEIMKTCQDKHTLRQLYLMAHVIRKKTILAATSSLYSDGDNRGKKYYKEQTLNAIMKMREGKLGKLALYVSQHSTEPQLFDKVLSLCKAAEVTEQILRMLRMRTIEQNLAYYTSMDTFFKMLPNGVKDVNYCGRLSIMNISYMNDPNEGKILRNCVCDGWSKNENGKNRKSAQVPYVFMKCFTSQIDYLPMWEMYGERAKGCCLVLDWEQSVAQIQIPLYSVCYVERVGHEFYIKKQDNRNIADTKKVQDYLKILAKLFRTMETDEWREMFCDILGILIYLFKDNSYYYEPMSLS